MRSYLQRAALSLLMALIICPGLASAQADETWRSWNQPVNPFRIIGNIYYVGASDITSFLITTPEGHILLDSGFAETVPLIEASVKKLGFNMRDIKILINSHAHNDHAGGMALLKEMTGAKLCMSEADSLLIAAGTVVLSTLVASMTAFALAHIKFFGSRFIMGYLMLGLLFPSATGILPLFIKMRDLGMLDSHWGIITVQVAFSVSFSVLLFHNFFKELPKELIDAARMDNCGYVRIYWYITLPLCLPIIATVGVFNFVGSWNSFLLPLIVLNSEDKYTWPLGIMQFQGQYGSDWPRILAFLTLSIMPRVSWGPDRFTTTRIEASPARCHSRFWAHALRITHSPIGTISPFSSAKGMNSDGRRRPSSGCRQRTSASAATGSPLAVSTIG